MLSVTRKTDYALVALVDLAKRAPERASARQIADAYQVPVAMLMNILKDMMRHGLVSATRGAKGGYCLTRDPEQITLAELLQAVEGPLNITLCCEETRDQNDRCDLEQTCPTKVSMKKVNEMLQQFLNQITLADVMSDTVPVVLRLTGARDDTGSSETRKVSVAS